MLRRPVVMILLFLAIGCSSQIDDIAGGPRNGAILTGASASPIQAPPVTPSVTSTNDFLGPSQRDFQLISWGSHAFDYNTRYDVARYSGDFIFDNLDELARFNSTAPLVRPLPLPKKMDGMVALLSLFGVQGSGSIKGEIVSIDEDATTIYVNKVLWTGPYGTGPEADIGVPYCLVVTSATSKRIVFRPAVTLEFEQRRKGHDFPY